MDKVELLSLLAQAPTQNSFFGPQGFELFRNMEQIQAAQIGFSVDEQGSSLCGEQPGQWQSHWLIVARDTELGDPYFIDTSDESLPVLTGFYGDSGWQAEYVARSLAGFYQCMALLYQQGKQTDAVFVAEPDTIIDPIALAQLKTTLVEASQCEDFWTLFFNCYLDWLSEDY